MNNHLKAANDFRDFQVSISSEAPPGIAIDVVVHVDEKRRRAAFAREVARRLNADEQNQLPLCKMKRQFKGASNHVVPKNDKGRCDSRCLKVLVIATNFRRLYSFLQHDPHGDAS